MKQALAYLNFDTIDSFDFGNEGEERRDNKLVFVIRIFMWHYEYSVNLSLSSCNLDIYSPFFPSPFYITCMNVYFNNSDIDEVYRIP